MAASVGPSSGQTGHVSIFHLFSRSGEMLSLFRTYVSRFSLEDAVNLKLKWRKPLASIKFKIQCFIVMCEENSYSEMFKWLA